MSRHLMARFRHLHASHPVNWQHGVLLPDTARHLKNYNEQKVPTNPKSYPAWRPENVSTATVFHGEQMHALQVSEEPYMINSVTRKSPWIWSIKVHKGDDPKDPNHWEYLNQVDENIPLPGDKHDWDFNGSLTGGQELHKSKEDENANSDGTDGGLWGYHADREGAMQAAENAWNKYVGNTSGTLSDYDINDIMNRFKGGEL